MNFITLKFLFFPIFFNIQNLFFVCLFIPVFGILCLLYSDFYDLEITLQEKIRKFVKYLQLFGTFLNIYNLYIILSYNINFEIFLWNYFEEINLSIYLGSINSIMLCLVNLIVFVVYSFSLEYMKTDPFRTKFLVYILMFQFFMYNLLIADNWILLIIGWEGIGLCSYLLIGYWITRTAANKAALKAMIVNSIGDSAILIVIGLCLANFETLNFESIILYATKIENLYLINTICILLLIAVMSKSAQIGLHIWLSDAMEGPTPVSALIHAATMVTAGVFLIIRLSPLFELSLLSLNLMMLLGGITAFIAGTIALVQYDIKKIIAFSTCSQLGYMVYSCGLSNYDLALFHLITHAFFKALLFLTAGSIIHSLNGEQDIRKMGGLDRILPLSYMFMLIGSLCITGYPFLSGYYSKDVILEISLILINYSNFNWITEFYFIAILLIFSAIFTIIYSFRLLYHVFWSQTNISKNNLQRIHEMNFATSQPLFILGFGSIIIGFILKDIFIGIGNPYFSDFIYILPQHKDFFILTELETSSGIKLWIFYSTIFFTFSIIIIYFWSEVRSYFYKFKINQDILDYDFIIEPAQTVFFKDWNQIKKENKKANISLYFKQYKNFFMWKFFLLNVVTIFNKIYNFLVNKWFFDKILVRGIAYNVLLNTKVVFNYIEDIYRSMKNIFDKNRNSEIEDFKKHISDINGQNLYIEVFGLLMSGFLCFIIDLTDIIEILTNFFIFISNIFNNIINVLIINFYDIINNSFIKMNTFEQWQKINDILKEDYSFLIEFFMSKEGKFVLLIILFFILFIL